MAEILVALLPVLLLLTTLLLGHYPGCDTIVRFGARRSARRSARADAAPRRPEAPQTRVTSGGLLLALGIARRPPPLPA